MSRLSRSGSLRASSSVSPPAASPLRPVVFSKSTSPSSPSPLSGIFSPHKRKDPPLSTAAEYDGIEEEEEDEDVSSSGDSADDGELHHHSFAAEYALASGRQHEQHEQRTVALPSTSTGTSPTPTQAAVRASALTAALSAVRCVSPPSTQSTPSPQSVSPVKQMKLVAARPLSPATSTTPFGPPSTNPSAAALLPATVLKGSNSLTAAANMELDESEEENDVRHRPTLRTAAHSSPPPAAASPPPPSTSLDWPPTPSLQQTAGLSHSPTVRLLSPAQRQRLSGQLSQHIDLTLSLRRLLAASMQSPTTDVETTSAMYRKASDLLSSLCALRVAHQRMYTQYSVLDVAQLDGLQQRLNSSLLEVEARPAGRRAGSGVAVQPTVAAAVVPKSGAARATMAGVVTATAVSGVPQYSINGWPGSAAMASVLPGQPVMATLGTATPAASYTSTPSAARLVNHSSAPAAIGQQPVAARLVQPAQRSTSNAVMATTAGSPSVAASTTAGSLTSALSSLSSSLASFANSPHHSRSPTPLMASLSLYPAQASPPAAQPVTATVMAAASPPSASSFSFSPTSIDHTVATSISPTTAVAVSSPATASSTSALSVSLARPSVSPTSNMSPSPGSRTGSLVPAVAVDADGSPAAADLHITPVSSSFSAQSELSSLDSFASLALASFSPSATSPLADSALSTLASLAHTDGSFSDSSPSPTQPAAHTTAPVSASSRSSSYRSSDQPNKRSRSQSHHEPDIVTPSSTSSSGLTSSHTLRKNRSQQGLSKLDTARTGSPGPASSSHPRLPSSASFTSLSSVAASTASSPSPTSPLPASGSFPAAVPASVLSNHSPRRRTYSPRSNVRRVVAASVVQPASVASTAVNSGAGLLSPSAMQVVAALWSGHEEPSERVRK